MDSQLKDLHETNGYVVGIQRIPNHNKIQVEYPSDIIREPDSKPLSTMYEVHNGYIYKYHKDDDIPSKLKCPEYTARVLVIMDILLTCVKKGINSLLIVNFDKDGKKVEDTLGLLDPPESKDEQELEQNFKVIFHQIMEGNNAGYLIDTGEVKDGYNLLLNVFKSGGF